MSAVAVDSRRTDRQDTAMKIVHFCGPAPRCTVRMDRREQRCGAAAAAGVARRARPHHGTRARETRAEALFCGGDLYENDRVAPDTAEFLRTAFAELAPTPVFLAPGNHDWYGPHSLYALVEWSQNVHVFTEPTLKIRKELGSPNHPLGRARIDSPGKHAQLPRRVPRRREQARSHRSLPWFRTILAGRPRR